MGMPQLVVTAVLVEGRSKSEVAREYGVSRRWVITLVQRYLAEGGDQNPSLACAECNARYGVKCFAPAPPAFPPPQGCSSNPFSSLPSCGTPCTGQTLIGPGGTVVHNLPGCDPNAPLL
jgi:hypothetical protein